MRPPPSRRRIAWPSLLAALLPLGMPAGAQVPVPEPPVVRTEVVPPGREPLRPRAGRLQEPAAPLDLRAALALAESSNPELAMAAREVDALEGSVLQAGLLPNPEIAIFAEEARRRRRVGELQLDQRIELGGKRAARVNAAEGGREAARADLAIARAQLRATVIAAFFDVLTAQERLRLADASLDMARRASTAALQRMETRKGSAVESVRARVAEAGMRIERSQAASQLAVARRQLSGTWGNPVPRFVMAQGALESMLSLPALTELVGRLEKAPGLVRARVELQRREALAALEHSRRVPDLLFSLGATRADEQGGTQPVFGVALPVPIFDRNQGNRLEAERRIEKARDALLAAEIRLESGVALAHERTVATRAELQVLRDEILPGAQAALDAVTVDYERGEQSFIDLLDAQRTLFDARAQYVQALTDAQRSIADIERALAADLLGLAGAEGGP